MSIGDHLVALLLGTSASGEGRPLCNEQHAFQPRSVDRRILSRYVVGVELRRLQRLHRGRARKAKHLERIARGGENGGVTVLLQEGAHQPLVLIFSESKRAKRNANDGKQRKDRPERRTRAVAAAVFACVFAVLCRAAVLRSITAGRGRGRNLRSGVAVCLLRRGGRIGRAFVLRVVFLLGCGLRRGFRCRLRRWSRRGFRGWFRRSLRVFVLRRECRLARFGWGWFAGLLRAFGDLDRHPFQD